MTFIVITVCDFFAYLTGYFKRTFGIALFLTMAFLMGGGIVGVTPDYVLYMTNYNSGGSYFELGYSFLEQLGNSLGMNYASFRLMVAILAATILIIGVLRVTHNIAAIALFYAISIFSIDAIQVRNSLMVSIVILAYSFLKKKDLKNYLISFSLIVVAISIHTLAIAFIIPIIISLLNLSIQKMLAYFLGSFSVLFILVGYFLRGSLLELSQLVLSLFSFREASVSNVGSIYNNAAGLRYLVLALIIGLLQLVVIMYIIQAGGKDEKIQQMSVFMLPVAILGIIAVIMMVVSSDYCRLLRNTAILTYIYIGLFMDRSSIMQFKKKEKVILFIAGLILSVLTLWLQDFMLYPDAGDVYGYTIGYLK